MTRKTKPKPWRASTNSPGPCDGIVPIYSNSHMANATVVPDSCFFPVKEAMAYLNQCYRRSQAKVKEEGGLFSAECAKSQALWVKYIKVVERLKRKKNDY